MERAVDSGELFYHVTEHRGAGMNPKECEMAIRFGLHAAKADAKALRNYSHNGIGTKACLNIFSRLAIFSICKVDDEGIRSYCLLLLDVADSSGSGACKPAKRVVWTAVHGEPDWGGANGQQTNIIREICTQVSQYVLQVATRTAPLTHQLAVTCSSRFLHQIHDQSKESPVNSLVLVAKAAHAWCTLGLRGERGHQTPSDSSCLIVMMFVFHRPLLRPVQRVSVPKTTTVRCISLRYVNGFATSSPTQRQLCFSTDSE